MFPVSTLWYGTGRGTTGADNAGTGVGVDKGALSMELSYTLVCHYCGKVVEEGSRLHPKSYEVYVVPCPDCMDDADSRGYKRGYDVGQSEGYEDGYSNGEAAVRDDVKAMLQLVKEESEVECAASKAGGVSQPSS